MNELQDWRSVAIDLARALKKLDALYRSEQDPAAPMSRPEWLRHTWQRYHRALAELLNDSGERPVETNKNEISAPDRTMILAQNFCERTISDLNRGNATLRYETLEAFERLCTQCGISTNRIQS